MPKPKEFDTGLSRTELNTIFQRILNGMTDEQINAKFDEITAKIAEIENRLTALEPPETEEENA